MAEENIIFNTEIKTGNSATSIKSIRTELRQLTQELAGLEPGSQAFVTAATRAGELRDRMDDASNAVKAFNPEAKFQAIANVVGIAANGFSALQGAMSLFGDESKDLQQVMARTQGAIALATGLNGLLGMGDAFKLLGTQVANLIPLLRGMSAAMLGALTGGITIAITLVISYWKELKSLITGTTEAVVLGEKEMAEAISKGHNEFKKAADERYDLEIRRLKTLKQTQEVEKQIAEQERLKAIADAVAEGKIKEYKAVINAEYYNKLAEIDKKYTKQYQDELAKRNKYAEEHKQKDIEDTRVQMTTKEVLAKSWGDKIKQINEQTKGGEEAVREAVVRLEREKQQARLEALQTTATALEGFAQLAGQGTALQKTLAIASTTIDTYLAAQKSYTSQIIPGDPTSPFRGALAAAAAVAGGIARVRAIMAVKVPGNVGGNNPMPSMGGIPSAPITRPSSSVVRLGNTEPIRTSQDNPQKVYVLESDITNTQNNVKSIRQKATIQ